VCLTDFLLGPFIALVTAGFEDAVMMLVQSDPGYRFFLQGCLLRHCFCLDFARKTHGYGCITVSGLFCWSGSLLSFLAAVVAFSDAFGLPAISLFMPSLSVLRSVSVFRLPFDLLQ
jgi:hypothetical protein